MKNNARALSDSSVRDENSDSIRKMFITSLTIRLALINIIRLMYMLVSFALGKKLKERLKITTTGSFAVRTLPRFICDVLFPGSVMLNVPYDIFYKSDDPWLLNCNKLVQKGDVFVDVGAFHGTYTFIASSAVGEEGKVVAIEPYLQSYLTILEKTKNLKLGNIVAVNVACGNKEGIARLWLSAEPYKHSINMKVGARAIIVRVRKLDDILKDLSIPKVNLIKIDVEGAELDVLRGATLILQNETRLKLVIELHARTRYYGYDYYRVVAFLSKHGFKCFQLSPRHILAIKM